MNNNSKIKLKNEDSNKNITNTLEKISTGNIAKMNHNNFKSLSNFLICAICVLVGICITPTLLQKQDKNVFVKHNSSNSQSTSGKEKPVKHNSTSHSKSAKKLNHKKPKPKNFKSKIKLNNKKLNNTKLNNTKLNNTKLNNNIGKIKGKANISKQCEDVHEINNDLSHQNSVYGNSIFNTLNGNFFAENADSFFYINRNDSNYVYGTNIFNGETELILDISCKEIFLLNNKLYVIPLDFGCELIIYDIQKNEYERTAVGEKCLSLNDNYIISCDNSGIYKSYMSDASRMARMIYTGNIDKCVLCNQTVYFIESNKLYSIDLYGSNKILIKENVQNFAINNSELYYVSNNRLYSTNSDEPLYDVLLSAINIYDNTIYFSNENDNGKLYSINMITSEIQKLSDNVAKQICVTKHNVAIMTPEGKMVII